MQLFIILALLLYGGKGGAQNLLSEVKPMLESFGGEEVKQGGAESGQSDPLESAFFGHSTGSKEDFSEKSGENGGGDFFPLAPIAGVASREITYSLSQYVS